MQDAALFTHQLSKSSAEVFFLLFSPFFSFLSTKKKKEAKSTNCDAERETREREREGRSQGFFYIEDRQSGLGGGVCGVRWGWGGEWVLSDFTCCLFKVCFTRPPTSNTQGCALVSATGEFATENIALIFL